MIRKFLNGLIFGCGFGIALVIILYIAAMIWTSDDRELDRSEPVVKTRDRNVPDFGGLSADEKAKLASVVMLVELRTDSAGQRRGYISEILKLRSGTDFSLQVGDEYRRASAAAKDWRDSDGAVVMLVGPEAKLKSMTNFRNGRIGAYGNITIDTFKAMVRPGTLSQ